MKNESFTTSIEIPRSPAVVFRALADVPKWWSTDYEGSSTKLGDEFVIHHPGAHYSKKRLVEVVPGKKMVWLVTEGTLYWLKDPHEWTNTRMVFELTPKGEGTVLTFTHEGLVPGLECYAKCIGGWTMVIGERLFAYITEGKTI